MFTRIKLWLLGAFGLLAAFFVAYMKGRASQAAENLADDMQNYIDTRSRIDEATRIERDADAAREWLRSRSE